MGKIIVFANQKGGVGKTTTTVNIGAYLAEADKKTLLVDFDPQGNLTSSLGVNSNKSGIYEVIMGKSEITSTIQSTYHKKLFVLSSNINLSGASVELVNVPNREFYLKKELDKVKNNFDYILIDCPPSLGLITLNGFAAADKVIVPLQCEFFALEGFFKMLFETIKRIQKTLNPSLTIAGIVFTMYDSRTRLGNDVIDKVKTVFQKHPELIFKTIIPRNVKLSEAPSHGKTINQYAPNSNGALSYKELAMEVLNNV
ncbi:MAG: ParA family protein [Spirochaetales bacterium]|nr:ParA family protein [Spirochaetales bacterium]